MELLWLVCLIHPFPPATAFQDRAYIAVYHQDSQGPALQLDLRAPHGPVRACKSSPIHTHNPTSWAQGPKASRKGKWNTPLGGKRFGIFNPSFNICRRGAVLRGRWQVRIWHLCFDRVHLTHPGPQACANRHSMPLCSLITSQNLMSVIGCLFEKRQMSDEPGKTVVFI